MTDHLTPHDTPHDTPTDDEFERLARAAGAELRRPAPPDGMQRVRAVRRRQQVTRSVMAGGAAVLIVGMGTFVALRANDDGGDVATLPDPTVPEPAPTTVPEPEPTAPSVPTTTPLPTTTTSVPPSATVQDWLAEQRAAGRTFVSRATGEGTDAYGLVAMALDGSAGSAGIVVLANGEAVAMPAEVAEGVWPTMRIYGLGGTVAVVAQPFFPSATATGLVPVELHLLDRTTREWGLGPDLGLNRALGQGLHVLSVDGSLIVGRSAWDEFGDNTATPSPERAGVIVRPDLTVEPIAIPPDGVQMSWTSAFGQWAFNFGYEPGALDYSSYTQPWKLDVAANEWSPITLPDWYACEPGFGCEWVTPHEFGDRFLEVITPRGVLKRLPDASVGVYDPAADSWTRMDDAPFVLAMPATAVLGDRVIVAPANAPYTEAERGEFGQVGVLDLTTGTWSVERFDVTDDDTRWDLRRDGTGALLQPDTLVPGSPLDLDRSFALDFDGDWRPTTPTDADRWAALTPQVDLSS